MHHLQKILSKFCKAFVHYTKRIITLNCLDAVLKAAVDYSVQYIPQRSLPDKAIDLIDVTAAHLASQHPVTDIKTLEADIADAKAKQEEFAQKEDYESAINEKMRIQKLQAEIDNHTENQKVVATS